MIEYLDIGVPKAVAYRISGKISQDEMHEVLQKITAKIDEFGEVYLYQEVESLGGVEFEAIVEKLKFLVSHGVSDIHKAAVITDKNWLHKVVQFEDKLFPQTELRSFSMDAKNDAVAFLRD